jgi:uncharacterized membrane protein required for colicin V production
MNWLDAIFIVVLVVFAILGIWKGLFRFIFLFLAAFLGAIIAGWASGPVAGWFGGGTLAQIASFAGIFIVATIILALLFRIPEGFLRRLPIIGWINRIGGLVFSLAIAGIICGVLITLLSKAAAGDIPSWVPISGELSGWQQSIATALDDSVLTSYILGYFSYILALIPDKFDAVRQFFGH